ncbi:MAG TPA: twin-arginine translocase subunit TatC [Bryobacteraceae bacterium]|jgi:sec-independent protein translocase protein TatC
MDEINGGTPPSEQPRAFPDDPHGPPPEKVYPPPALAVGGGGSNTPPPPPPADEDDEEEDGMLRMSFLEHLEELRSRIIKMVYGFGVVFLLCMIFCQELFKIVMAPGFDALKRIGNPENHFVAISPMEQFSIIWLWTPLVAAIFLGSPWILWQVWSFIAPGLYQKEKRLAVPFVTATAGLFILGGCFGYFLAFRYGLTFLFSLGGFAGIVNMISIDQYFSMFVDVMLGIGLVFEIPVLIFFLTLLHVASPSFLLAHSRYAILAITILAAIITPTPDFFNMMLFAVPMCLLFFLGVFASYLLVLKRENRRFPWKPFLAWILSVILIVGAAIGWLMWKFSYHLTWHWPFLMK